MTELPQFRAGVAGVERGEETMATKHFEDITRQDLEAYERVRVSGHWNMFSLEAQLASGLDKDTYFGVRLTYGGLVEKFPGVRKEE